MKARDTHRPIGKVNEVHADALLTALRRVYDGSLKFSADKAEKWGSVTVRAWFDDGSTLYDRLADELTGFVTGWKAAQ